MWYVTTEISEWSPYHNDKCYKKVPMFWIILLTAGSGGSSKSSSLPNALLETVLLCSEINRLK